VTFDPVFFANPKSTALPSSPISITSDVEIIGPAAGVSLTGLTLSISGGTVALSNLTFRGQMSAPFIDVSGHHHFNSNRLHLRRWTILCQLTADQ
jgi:hypothetical protein